MTSLVLKIDSSSCVKIRHPLYSGPMASVLKKSKTMLQTNSVYALVLVSHCNK